MPDEESPPSTVIPGEELGCFIKSNEDVILPAQKGKYEKNDCLIIHLFGKHKLEIIKPLICMKISYFVYGTAGASQAVYFPLFLRDRGISIEELSATVAASGFLQLVLPFVSGIVADKIGRSKPILIFYICFIVLLSVCFIFIPATETCAKDQLVFKCISSHHANLTYTSNICNTIKQAESCVNENYTCSPQELNQDVISFHHCSSNRNTSLFENLLQVVCGEFLNDTCGLSCEAEKESCIKSEKYRSLLLSTYFVMISFFYFLRSTTQSFFEVTVVKLTKQYKVSYGFQRVWNILGYMLGYVVSDYIVTDSRGTDYMRFLYFFIACNCLAVIVIFKVNVQSVEPNKQILQTTKMLFRKPDLLSFVLVLLFCGIAFGFEVVYFSWYLREIGTSPRTISMIGFIATFYSLGILFFSKRMTKILTNRHIFLLSLLSHGAYNVCFSYLSAPWPAFIVEVFFSFSLDLFWVAVVQHCQTIAPAGMISTVIATASALHFSMGVVFGTAYGGMVINQYGFRTAYRVLGIVCYIVGILYLITFFVPHLCKKQNNHPTIEKENEDVVRVED